MSFPEQRLEPGTQFPVHCPAPVQTYLHVLVADHPVPEELHVCTLAPEHCVAPGEQTALHVPAVTTPGTHTPELLHVSGVVLPAPLQCLAPGVQAPHAPLDSQIGPAAAVGQFTHAPLMMPQASLAVPFTHWPLESQQPPLHVAEPLHVLEQAWFG